MTVSALAAQNTAVDFQVARITPALAEELLEKNAVNRSLRSGVVEAYRRDMEQGRWRMTGEPIQFSRTDRLLNGQHRLTALAGSNVTQGIEFLVITGLDDYAQELMDSGASRSISDALKIRGHVKNVTVVASVARWLVAHPEPGMPGMLSNLKRKVSSAEAIQAFQQFPDIAVAAERAVAMKNAVPGSISALAYAWLHLNRVDPAACNEFFGAMVDLSFGVEGDPRKAALRRLQTIANDASGRGNKDTSVAVISVLTRAWNDWRRGKKINSYLARNSRGQVIEPVKPI